MSAVIGVGVSIAAIQGMLAIGGVAAVGVGAGALYIATESQRVYGRFQRVCEEWANICEHQEIMDRAVIVATETRAEVLRNAYETMRTTHSPEQEQIRGVMQQISSETEFLRSEITRLRQNILEHRIADSAKAGYVRQAASLLEHADALPEDVRSDLKRVVGETLSEGEMERILRRALERGAEPTQTTFSASAEQQHLLTALREAEAMGMAEKWLANRKNPKLQRLQAYVAEIELFYPERAALFTSRIAELERTVDLGSLALDSLLLDLRESLDTGRLAKQRAEELCGIMEDVRIYAAALELSDSLLAFADRAEQALSAHDTEAFEALAEEGRMLLEDAMRRLAAAHVRQEILASLAELGYEVEEASAAMWQENGRLVVRDHAAPQYGVEVGGDAGKRLQFRLVGLTGEVDARRDYEMESAWCDTFERLQGNLSAQGTELLVEKRVQPGEVPLKRLMDTVTEQRAQSRVQAKFRQS